MFEGRAEQVDLISLLSTGEARGANSLLWMCLICVKDVAAAVVRIYFELCCLIVGETFFQPTQLSGFVLRKWEGEGDVDYDMFAKECKVERRHSGKDVSERHHPSRAELCLRGLSGR